MWLHVPTTLLASVPDTAESNLDSEKLSLLEQSAMWKSKSASQQSWQRVWKRDTSIRRLSGLTSKHSTLSRGVEKLTSSLAASLASPSQSQGRSSEKMTQETSGQIQPDLYGGLGHQLSFSKMFPESLSITSVQSDPNYERWVTRLRKDYSQRQRQAHPTNASESSFWPTARASDNEGGIPSNVELSEGSFSRTNADGVRWGVKLKDATAHWPTMTAGNPSNANSKRRSDSIYGAVEKWPTPLASDENYRVPSENWNGTDLPSVVSNWPTPTASEKSGTNPNTGKGEGLNKTAKHWPTPKAGNPGSRKPGTGGKVLNEEAKKWPTPNVSDNNDPNLKDNHDLEKGYLRGVATTWQTPQARDYKGPNTGFQEMLPNQALNWGTPTSRDWKDGTSAGTVEENGLLGRQAPNMYHSILPDPETETDGHTCSPSCRRLNPLFAEHLMGLPLGWTCVSGPLETESFQRWQLALSAYLARN